MDFHGVLEELAAYTPHRIRARGKTYAAEGRVGGIAFTRNGCQATVRGSGGKTYQCEIVVKDRKSRGIGIYCTCPAFDRENICKHLYALAIKLDKEQPDPEEFHATRFWEDLLSTPVNKPPSIAPAAAHVRPVRLYYLLEVEKNQYQRHSQPVLRLGLFQCQELKSGAQRLKPCPFVDAMNAEGVPDSEKLLVARLHARMSESFSSYAYAPKKYHEMYLNSASLIPLLEPLVQTGHLFWKTQRMLRDPQNAQPVREALDESWTFELRGRLENQKLHIRPALHFRDQQHPPDAARFAHHSGYLLWNDRLTRFANPEFAEWLEHLAQPPPPLPAGEVDRFLRNFYDNPRPPPLSLPPELAMEEIKTPPAPRLRIEHTEGGRITEAFPEFIYEFGTFEYDAIRSWKIDWENRKIFRRHLEAERAFLDQLTHLGGVGNEQAAFAYWRFNDTPLPTVAETLLRQGWEVLFKRKRLRPRGEFSLQVESSGIDWLDVHGAARFGEQEVTLPELLAAADASLEYLELKNGEVGLLPEEIRQKLTLLQRLAAENPGEDEALRFRGAGSVMLDLLLEEEPYVNWSASASGFRQRLRELGRPRPADPPPGFQGTLREYQREGLGWLRYLRETGLNGCLADDMGLGKTVQVLALLEELRQQNRGPFLVVAPKTLAFNWQAESRKFTPGLRTEILAGPQRPKHRDELPAADLYIISYPLLLRDIGWLKDLPFDTVVLDESQAIKNPDAKTTKAARLLQADHRLTLTGTPVENRLDDLWSQLNFLNPGMLGRVVQQEAGPESDSLNMVARAVRPFLLRRTKEQVATDLPEKVEETHYCELSPSQRKTYNQLKTYYRASLAQGISGRGFGKSKILILEALLRLRQAACHPGLISEKYARGESAKLSLLSDLLTEILEAGHKALIFSQFTAFLGLVRERLDREHRTYAYLDGQSKDRQESVHRFQTDPDCRLFLISLKAGGTGLNLTAADYVILLDPWWNPAAESQAIDRAHRIGQNKKVFAYRIVARDTIEEKILALQKEKRELADAILTRENALLSKLTPEDLDFLLS